MTWGVNLLWHKADQRLLLHPVVGQAVHLHDDDDDGDYDDDDYNDDNNDDEGDSIHLAPPVCLHLACDVQVLQNQCYIYPPPCHCKHNHHDYHYFHDHRNHYDHYDHHNHHNNHNHYDHNLPAGQCGQRCFEPGCTDHTATQGPPDDDDDIDDDDDDP